MPHPPTVPARAQRVGRWLVYACVAAYFACGLAYLALRHYVWPRLDDWRAQLVEQVSVAVGRPVQIARIGSGFEGLLPRLTLEEITIADDDGRLALEVPHAVAVLSARTLATGEPRLSVLQLDSPRVRVERLPGGRALRVAGVEVPLDRPSDGSALDLLLGQRRILVRNAEIEWIDREHDARRTFAGVDLRLGSVGRRHRGTLSLGPADDAWRGVALAFEFYRPPRSRVDDWRRWNGEVFAGADDLDWSALAALWPQPLPGPLVAGRASLRGWLAFDQGRAQDAVVKLAARDAVVRLEAPEGGPGATGAPAAAPRGAHDDLVLSTVDAEARARPAGDGYELRVQRLEAAEPGGVRLVADGEQQVVLDRDGAPVRGRAALRPFDVERTLDLARRLPLPDATARALKRASASGRISSASVRWETQPSPQFEASVEFDALSLHYEPPARAGAAGGDSGAPAPRVPWFENLAGEARVTQSDGQIRVRSKGATLGFPGIFTEPAIGLDTLKADAKWTLDASGAQPALLVEIEDLQFANADAAGVVTGTYRTGGKGPGLVDLNGRVERAQARRAARYLPLQIPQSVRDWIAASVTGGELDDGRLRLRGDLADFPYRRAEEGEFTVSARLADGTLAYAPGWPAIERLQGNLLFERAGMTIAMRTGRVFGVTLGATQAQLREYEDGQLRIDGSGEGPAQDMIRFVNDSPVATRIDDFTRDTVARGDAKLQLRLDLPLGALEQTRVAGTVQFRGNDLTLDSTIPPFSAVSGALEFSERGLALRGIGATFLGGPLRVDGETPEPGRFLIRGEGRVAAQGMRSVVDNPITRALSGEAAYRATVDVRRRAASVLIESDLEGLGAAMPAPFDKPASARWPLRVQTTADVPSDPNARSARDAIRVELRDSFRLALERERDPRTQKLLIRRGAFAINAEPVLQDRGLAIALNTGRVDVDAWMPLLAGSELRDAGGRAASEFAEGFSLMPDAVSVVAGEVRVGGKQLHDVVFGASRVGGFWRANISAREVNGFFNWRDAAPGQRIGTLTARFTRLEIPKSRASEIESLLDTPPEDLPALDVAAEEFVLGERHLGSLALTATNRLAGGAPVWALDRLEIRHPSATFSAQGTWARRSGASGRSTRLEFGLELADAGQLLGVYGMKDVLRGGAGRISGTLQWNGSPLGIDYPSLTGRLDLAVGKGQFLKTEPGIAKLIGVLSLQSLPRRLSLDFRDVFAEGFAFDEITGDVRVEQGVARTDRFSMRGVQANVRITGQADLATETQALEVEVRPELNAGLASLAYGAMVHPAIGLGSFIAQLALRRPIEELFTYEYEVTGSWSDPQVSERRRSAQSGAGAAPPASAPQ